MKKKLWSASGTGKPGSEFGFREYWSANKCSS